MTSPEGNTLGAVLLIISNNWITSGSSKTQNERFMEIMAWSTWACTVSALFGLKGMSIPLNAWGRMLVCFDFLAGCELDRLYMLTVPLVLELTCLRFVECLTEGLDNCLKTVAPAIPSTEAWTQGSLLPRIWAIKAILSPLTCPASLQAVAIVRIIYLL